MKNKKAQVKMFETIAVLVVFFFLLIFGLSFYTSLQLKSFQAEERKNADLEAIKIAQKAAHMPELQCSKRNIPIDACFDIEKAKTFFWMTTESTDRNVVFEEYYKVFGFSSLSVEEIYPEKETAVVYEIYNNEPAGDTTLKSTRIPVALYEPVSNIYTIGVLSVNVFNEKK